MLLVIVTDPSAGKCLATFSITIRQPGFVIIGMCNLGSGSLCQLRVDLGCFNKILTLPGHVEIYPGAQAGSVCGAGLSAKPSSTISFEKRFNTSLKDTREGFIKNILENIPPKPDDMLNVIKQNIQ